jgi:hypothetical protein
VFSLSVADAGDVHGVWHERVAGACIGFWERVVIDLVAAYVVAYAFSASAAVYMLMRRICDGQDIQDIWRPGLTPGTLVPLPRTATAPPPSPPGAAERALGGALRSATAARYGGTRSDEGSEEAGEGDGAGTSKPGPDR